MTSPTLRFAYLSAYGGHKTLVDEIRIGRMPGRSLQQLLKRLNVVMASDPNGDPSGDPSGEADGDGEGDLPASTTGVGRTVN